MSDQDKYEQIGQIQWKEDDADQFFQCLHGDWMPYNSSQIHLPFRQYVMLFDTIDLKQSSSITQKICSNRQSLGKRLNASKLSSNLCRTEPTLEQNQEIQKNRLAQKIQAILSRRNVATITQPLRSTNSINPQTDQNVQNNKFSIIRSKKRRRAVITKEILEKAKKLFQVYNLCCDKPVNQKITFREIGVKLGVSATETTKLYQQYSKDPLFMNRMKKFEVTEKYRKGPPDINNHSLNKQRLKFILGLIKQNPNISQHEIIRRINQETPLLESVGKGVKSINSRMIMDLMKIGGALTPKFLPKIEINSSQFISRRYQYAQRYVELAKDPAADIYFMGQYSFANTLSYSGCTPNRISKFVDQKQQLNRSQQEINKNKDMKQQIVDLSGVDLQHLVLISQQGLIYYKIISHIDKEMNFTKIVSSISEILMKKSKLSKKYIILDNTFLHQKEVLQGLEKHCQISIVFLPPQSPMLNPLEYLIIQLKSLVEHKVEQTKRSYADALSQYLQIYKQHNLKHFYKCIHPYLGLALKKLPIQTNL